MRMRTYAVLSRTLLILLVLGACADLAVANGMAWVHRSGATGTGEVGQAVPTDQRAALVRDGTSWSLILEPRYERPDAGAAWLVPFAHCPTVSAADPALLAELGLATAPLFLELCVKECNCGDDGGSGCLGPFAGKAGDAGADDASAAKGAGDPVTVDVWQSGSIGVLDFVVISAANPADIPAWLDQEGYDSPRALADFVVDHASAYGCYFAAKIAARGGGQDAFPSVRFDLDPRDPPTYPLQLTRLGVADDATLGLTLFVVNPSDRFDDGSSTVVVPANFSARTTSCAGRTSAEFRACLDAELQAAPQTLAVAFHDALGSRKAAFLDQRICDFQHQFNEYWMNPGWCMNSAGLFPGIPDDWTPEVRDWMTGHVRVTRYEGRLPSAMLARDLIFHVGPGTPASHCHYDSDCYAKGVWAWDGSICTAGGTCQSLCYDDVDCPAGWSCLERAHPGGYYQASCAPATSATPTLSAILQDPLPRVHGLHVTYETKCDLKCDDICDGRLASGVVALEPARPPRQVAAKISVVVVLLASQLALAAARRRRS